MMTTDDLAAAGVGGPIGVSGPPTTSALARMRRYMLDQYNESLPLSMFEAEAEEAAPSKARRRRKNGGDVSDTTTEPPTEEEPEPAEPEAEPEMPVEVPEEPAE
jgi:hypothetical protein